MAGQPRSDQAGNPNILYVCRTCPRYEPPPPEGGRRCGEALAARVKELARDERYSDMLKVLVVTCLSGCPSPCNASLGAVGKTRIRFSRLGPDDAMDLLAAAERYAASAEGELAPDQVPEALRAKLSARSPGVVRPRVQFSGRRA